jgi:hypothetical protein
VNGYWLICHHKGDWRLKIESPNLLICQSQKSTIMKKPPPQRLGRHGSSLTRYFLHLCTGQRPVKQISFQRRALERPSETLSVPVWATTQSIVASCGVQHLVDLYTIFCIWGDFAARQNRAHYTPLVRFRQVCGKPNYETVSSRGLYLCSFCPIYI